MKITFLAGWACFAVELIFLVFLFVTQNAGDDAAGRGVATGFGIVLLPFVVITGGLLYWGQKSSSRAVQWLALLVVAIPFLIGGGLWANDAISVANERTRAAHAGDFDDPRLTALAHAIDAAEPTALESLLSTIMSGNTPGTLALLRTVLKAGADPNTPDRDGLPLIHITNGWKGAEKIDLLIAHGADLKALNNRPDRPQWTALMNAAYMQDWELALYFLSHGIAPDYKAPDGNTLASILDQRVAKYAAYQESPPPGYLTLRAALLAKAFDYTGAVEK